MFRFIILLSPILCGDPESLQRSNKKSSYFTSYTNLKNAKLTLKLLGSINVLDASSKNIIVNALVTSRIRRFYSNFRGHNLIIELFNEQTKDWAEIQCNCSDFRNHIEIGGCNISFKDISKSKIHNSMIEQKIRLNKKTNYRFILYRLNLTIKTNPQYHFIITIRDFSLQFENYANSCIWNNSAIEIKNIEVKIMDVLCPCKPECMQAETEIYETDSLTTINTKFTTNMSFSTNKPVSSQTPNIQRTRFWTKRNMWIIFLIFYPNYLIFLGYIRIRLKSKLSKNSQAET
ncbi:hypothetical protein RF11_14134 [Thelohanellus kitauei]|uniref:Uncharacterized protein n=1 Tax=Thelohanellus kitauei TaxID=669202 RepID=A0A0C2J3F6_THEKT|nr:hypothetical protein RF11_14440 [Thelohanellus kitauei]KII72384.1 hypothetical protein RF11_14134 [Thelohanellus kitauei]